MPRRWEVIPPAQDPKQRTRARQHTHTAHTHTHTRTHTPAHTHTHTQPHRRRHEHTTPQPPTQPTTTHNHTRTHAGGPQAPKRWSISHEKGAATCHNSTNMTKGERSGLLYTYLHKRKMVDHAVRATIVRKFNVLPVQSPENRRDQRRLPLNLDDFAGVLHASFVADWRTSAF